VIADSLLRGVSGISLASQMKRAKPTVPIVMLSGAAPEQIRHVDCYIHKGEPVPEMLAIIRGLLTRAKQ